MLQAELERKDVDVTVESAGFHASHQPAAAGSLREAAVRGLDLSTHRSRRVEAPDLRRADLVLTMELAQLRDAVTAEAGCWPRAFTVRGFLRRADSVAPQVGADGRGWLAGVHAGRRAGDLLRAGTVDDVPDPMGGPPAAFAAMGAEFDDLAPAVARLIAG